MHYKTKDLSLPLQGVDKFLMQMKDYKKASIPLLSLTKTNLPKESTIAILSLYSDVNNNT